MKTMNELSLDQQALDTISCELWAQMNRQILEHPAWQGALTVQECTQMLTGADPFTFILFQDTEADQYGFCFVKGDGEIAHKTVRIDRDTWIFENGFSRKHPILEEMIALAMSCERQRCKPFSRLR
jgi:hypothetical protein